MKPVLIQVFVQTSKICTYLFFLILDVLLYNTSPPLNICNQSDSLYAEHPDCSVSSHIDRLREQNLQYEVGVDRRPGNVIHWFPFFLSEKTEKSLPLIFTRNTLEASSDVSWPRCVFDLTGVHQ